MNGWLDALQALQHDGKPAVLVTLLSVRGSTPREAGCKMVVSAGVAHGTIGGGNLEFQSLRRARDLLASPPQAPVVAEFPLGPALGQCCGGHASVLFEQVRPPAWQIAVYGAGHVGRALVGLLGSLDCRVVWIDPRQSEFSSPLPSNVTAQPDCSPDTLPAGTFVLVLTHDHARDFDLVAAALPCGQLPFVGLIGSETKRARFVSRLARLGLPPEQIKRLACPIGLPATGGKPPAEIAISVAAQLLQLRGSATVVAAPQPARVAASCAGCGMSACMVAEEMRHDA